MDAELAKLSARATGARLDEAIRHRSIQTTARYARVTKKRIRETPSPLDLLPQRR